MHKLMERLMSEPRLLVMSAALFMAIVYIIYQLLDSTKRIKKEQLVQGSKYVEKQIENMLQVEKSQVLWKYRNYAKELLPHNNIMNIYMIILLAIVFAFIAYEEASKFFNQVIAGLLIGFIVFALPFVILEFLVSLRRKKVRKHLPHFLLMFQQTHEVTGDSLQTLMTIRDNIKDPIRGYIKEFIKNINKGMELKEATEILKARSDNEVFRSFAENIMTDIEYGKMIKMEIETNIKQAFLHEENYAQRITENSGNIVSIFGVLLMFALGVNRLLSINDEFAYILINNAEGKIAVDLVIGIMILVFYFIKKSINYEDH